MTADEKTSLARFVDLAAVYYRDGYRHDDAEREYRFSDYAALASPVIEKKAGNTTGSSADSLERIAAEVKACDGCPLCATRKHAVPGEGVPRPLVMVIGEGPGADEDATGRPFVGRAGQLLDKMLAAIDLSRESNCFIANVIKCRPPGNRDPLPEETTACASFLQRQITLLEPRFILSAGRISAQTLLKTGETIGKIRGKFIDYQIDGKVIPFIATYHPSALLRNEDYKRPAWEDLKLLRSALQGFGNR